MVVDALVVFVIVEHTHSEGVKNDAEHDEVVKLFVLCHLHHRPSQLTVIIHSKY